MIFSHFSHNYNIAADWEEIFTQCNIVHVFRIRVRRTANCLGNLYPSHFKLTAQYCIFMLAQFIIINVKEFNLSLQMYSRFTVNIINK